MVHIWYVTYGEQLELLTLSQIYPQLLTEVQTQDPYATIVEIRQYPYQLAVYVDHPTYTARTINGQKVLVDINGQTLFFPAFIIPLIWAIVGIITAVGFVIIATTIWQKETKTYCCTGDPAKPQTEECALHTDAQGNPLVFGSYEEFIIHLASAHATAADYLKNIQQKPWWEGIGDIFKYIIILVGIAVILPVVVSLIPRKKK